MNRFLAKSIDISRTKSRFRSSWSAAYPELARVARIEAKVILQATVSREGSISDIEILACKRPNMGFEEAALMAVRQWRYLPAMKGDEPQEVIFTVRIDFELR